MHDCDADVLDKGRTTRGTAVQVHHRSETCDAFLKISDMKNRYFAGYSNAVKAFLPGISSFESELGNHRLALDDRSTFGVHPWHPDPAGRDNPLAAGMVEAMNVIIAVYEVFSPRSISDGQVS